MPRFTVTELEPGDLAEAWPLVRIAGPQLNFGQWQQSACAIIARGGGILGVAAEDGPLLGVATYEPAERPRFGKVLRVETLVAFELTRRAKVRTVLCGALDRIAPLLGCTVVTVGVRSRGFVGCRPANLQQSRAIRSIRSGSRSRRRSR